MGFAHISHRISNVSNYKIYIGHRSIQRSYNKKRWSDCADADAGQRLCSFRLQQSKITLKMILKNTFLNCIFCVAIYHIHHTEEHVDAVWLRWNNLYTQHPFSDVESNWWWAPLLSTLYTRESTRHASWQVSWVIWADIEFESL